MATHHLKTKEAHLNPALLTAASDTASIHSFPGLSSSNVQTPHANDNQFSVSTTNGALPHHWQTSDPVKEYPIAIYTFGCFSIFKNGELLNGNGNGQHKPHELLKLLVALGGRSVGEVRISDALWPEADGDVAHTSFSVTLHRIRKLMGIKAIHLVDGHLSLDPALCWVDVWALQHVLGKIKDMVNSRQVDIQALVNLSNQAMQLYHGHFLGNEDEQPWYIAFREKMKNKFLRLLLSVCDYLESQGRCDLAMDFYRKGIEVDQLSEEFYLRMMKCYTGHGRKVEAMNVYQQCQKVFTALTGCEPSEETRLLYQSLQNRI